MLPWQNCDSILDYQKLSAHKMYILCSTQANKVFKAKHTNICINCMWFELGKVIFVRTCNILRPIHPKLSKEKEDDLYQIKQSHRVLPGCNSGNKELKKNKFWKAFLWLPVFIHFWSVRCCYKTIVFLDKQFLDA